MDETFDPAALEAAAQVCFADHWDRADEGRRRVYRHRVSAAIRVYLAARREAGWVEAPLEPTEEMGMAASDVVYAKYGAEKDVQPYLAAIVYRAMLAAIADGTK